MDGGAGSFTPLHHDLTTNILTQLVGSMKIILVLLSETAKLHPSEGVFSDVVDLGDPERLAVFPTALG